MSQKVGLNISGNWRRGVSQKTVGRRVFLGTHSRVRCHFDKRDCRAIQGEKKDMGKSWRREKKEDKQ